VTAPNPVVCASSLIAAGNVRRLRDRAGWSQHRLAGEAGMSACMVNFLEAGQRNFTLPMLERVAAALGTSASALLEASGSCGHCAGAETRNALLLERVAALGETAAGLLAESGGGG